MDDNLIRFKKDVKMVCLDCETMNLNLNFQYNRFWQCGMVQGIGEKIVDARDIRVNWPDAPHLKVGAEAAAINHYDHALQQKLAISPEEAMNKIWPWLEDADYVIIHNGLNFDLYLLIHFAKMFNKPWKFLMDKILDTKALAMGIKMKIPYKKSDGPFIEYQYRMTNTFAKGVKTNLTVLAKEYGISIDENRFHEAVYDVGINFQVWNKMKYQIEI